MRLLLIKTSSLGDIVHTFPALTDALQQNPALQVDWVVEEAFAELAAHHPAVKQVIPCAIRRWRTQLWASRGERKAFKQQLRQVTYDKVIDAQGLIKSGLITRLAQGPKFGLDKASAREGWSARFLDHPQQVSWDGHAVERVRQLFALSLGYARPDSPPDYGIARQQQSARLQQGSRLIFFHGTTWATKHYPEIYWRQLCELAGQDGCELVLPWGNEAEKARADRLASGLPHVTVLERLSLNELFRLMLTLDGFIAVDTGLAHLAAAAGLMGVALYGPTDPTKTGVIGVHAKSLSAGFSCAPCNSANCHYKGTEDKAVWPACFSKLPPTEVWQQLKLLSAAD